MDRGSNADDVSGRVIFTHACGPQSAARTSHPVPGIHLSHEEGPQERTAGIQDTFSDPSCDDVCSGCGSHASFPHRMERAIANEPLVLGGPGQRDWQISRYTSEGDEITEHHDPAYRPLEQRDPDGLSRPPAGAQSSCQNPNTDISWVPFWTRRPTSLLFVATFTLMAATLETLFIFSQRNSGLSRGMPFIRYSWSYGTTGILTLIAALWHRLDYETKVSAPWLRAYTVTTSKYALEVDYIDAWSVLIPFRALRNKDYEVVQSSTISLLLQVLIVLSTALFTLAPTNMVNEAEPVFLTSRFVDDPARLKNSESLLPYYITMGTEFPEGDISDMPVMRGDSTHPEGCTNQFAYQTFYPASSSLEEVKTTVDGLALRLNCETASVGERVTMPNLVYGPNGSFFDEWRSYFELDYQGCQAIIPWDAFTYNEERQHWFENDHTFREHAMVLRDVTGFARNQCNSTDQAARRLVLLSAGLEWRSNNQSIDFYEDGRYETVSNIDANVSQAVALVCAPSLEQTLLDVSRSSGGVQSVSRHSGNPADLLRVIQSWDFIEFFFERVIVHEYVDEIAVGATAVWADFASQAVLAFCGQPCLGGKGNLNDTVFLQDSLTTFLTDCFATTAHTMLTERVNITSSGTSLSIVGRLWVQPLACQGMVALLALITLTMLGLQLKHKNKLPRRVSSGSIAATAILAGRVASSTFPKDLGAASAKDLSHTLDTFLATQDSISSYRLQHLPTAEDSSLTRTMTDVRPSPLGRPVFRNPLPLRPVSHIALVWTIAACGTTLMVLLRKSVDEQGLGDAAASEYLLLAWTTVPATILTVISWWISSIDTQIRLLAPYHLLKSNMCNRSVLRMDLLRGLIPVVLYQELKTSNLAAASTTLAGLLAAILTTVSAAMFHAVTFPISRPVELSSNTAFMSPDSPLSLEDIARFPSRLPSLILETNLSYPQGSYEDLVFPEFFMKPLATVNASHKTNASSAVIKVTAPALRPRLSCRMYSATDIAAVYVRYAESGWSSDQWNGILLNITLENCATYVSSTSTAYFETGNRPESMFATATVGNQVVTMDLDIPARCSDMLYIWGYHDTSVGPVTNISAAGCNQSVELVDVTFSLLEPDLRLDPSDAPAIVESTARDIRGHEFLGSYTPYELYTNLASLPVTDHNVFDPFFQQLVTSRYAIPLSSIGDPTQADIVMDAIRLQHGIIGAQILNSNYRIDTHSATAMENASAVLIPTLFNQSTSNGSTSYPATVTYPFGSRRVVQDPTATAILEALLLSILILLMLGWYLGPREPALPRSPSSVGSVLALLAGGNVLERLYDGGPEPQCWDDVKSRLGKDSKLYLGWNTVNDGEGDEQRRSGIWITD